MFPPFYFILQKYYPIEACVQKIFEFSMRNERMNPENLKILTWENMIKKGGEVIYKTLNFVLILVMRYLTNR